MDHWWYSSSVQAPPTMGTWIFQKIFGKIKKLNINVIVAKWREKYGENTKEEDLSSQFSVIEESSRHKQALHSLSLREVRFLVFHLSLASVSQHLYGLGCMHLTNSLIIIIDSLQFIANNLTILCPFWSHIQHDLRFEMTDQFSSMADF